MRIQKRMLSLHRLSDFDYILCLEFNSLSGTDWLRKLFQLISRLGDGAVWYFLMLLFPLLNDLQGLEVSLVMLLTGVVNLALYKLLKQQLGRERPYVTHAKIVMAEKPLDRFSFPSGHTLHAVGFSYVVILYYPMLAWLVVPLTILIMLSRMILGLHYPSDVIFGALAGLTVSYGVMQIIH